MRKEGKQIYASYGVDVNKALKELAKTKISVHCWQLDDVAGFENGGALTGGIQTTQHIAEICLTSTRDKRLLFMLQRPG